MKKREVNLYTAGLVRARRLYRKTGKAGYEQAVIYWFRKLAELGYPGT